VYIPAAFRYQSSKGFAAIFIFHFPFDIWHLSLPEVGSANAE
jgi:hypothetical protein